MPVAAIELIATIAMWIINWGIKKIANKEEQDKAFQSFAELARSMNLKTITARLEAEKQLEAGSDRWDEIEAEEKSAKH